MTDASEPIAEDTYDELADSYEQAVETNPYNDHLAFPATTRLVPDVSGARVLDAGCGAGRHTAWLTERGASVVGMDVSRGMLGQARERVESAAFTRGDLSGPFGFREASFDGAISALALGYVRDWRAAFDAFARVLRPGGFLVVSVKHPFDEFPPETDRTDADRTVHDADDEAPGERTGDDGEPVSNYFETELVYKDWQVGSVPYYRRPVSAVIEPLLAAGFRLERFEEPQPTEEFREAWPERYETESKRPVFLCFRARIPETGR